MQGSLLQLRQCIRAAYPLPEEDWQAFSGSLRKAQATDINATRVPVSISKRIRLKLGDTFRFLIAHNERHILQAKKHLDKNTPARPHCDSVQ